LRIQVLARPARSATASEKVFWFFSSEKNAFLVPARPERASRLAKQDLRYFCAEPKWRPPLKCVIASFNSEARRAATPSRRVINLCVWKDNADARCAALVPWATHSHYYFTVFVPRYLKLGVRPKNIPRYFNRLFGPGVRLNLALAHSQQGLLFWRKEAKDFPAYQPSTRKG